MIDLSDLLLPISEDLPCGECQNNSPLYFEMLEAKGGEERQSFSGDGTGSGEKNDSDWKLVKKSATQLLTDSHDIEIAALLNIALLHTDGFLGLASGLRLTRELLEKYWDNVYPELDMDYPDEPDEQAFARINILAELGSSSFKLDVRKRPVISHKILGEFSLNDIQEAHSENPPESAHKPEHIDGAFVEMGLDVVKEVNDAVNIAIFEAETIENIFKEKTGPASFPDLSGLRSTLGEIKHILAEKVQDSDPEETDAEEGSLTGSTDSQHNAKKISSGQIGNRDDVVKAIDKICEYYRKIEPGSPVPLILERAKKLVDKNFLEILEDLSQDGLAQVKQIVGESTQ